MMMAPNPMMLLAQALASQAAPAKRASSASKRGSGGAPGVVGGPRPYNLAQLLQQAKSSHR